MMVVRLKKEKQLTTKYIGGLLSMETYSLATVEPTYRYQYWNDVVTRRCAVASHKTLESGEKFHASFKASTIDDIQLCEMSASSHSWRREKHHIKNHNSGEFLLAAINSGKAIIQQEGKEVLAQQGDLVLYDTAKPFQVHLEPKSVFLLRIPRNKIINASHTAEQCTIETIARKSSVTGLLINTINELSKINHSELTPLTQAQLVDSIIGLLGATLDIHCSSKSEFLRDDIFINAKNFLSKYAQEPQLSLEEVAMALGISSRHLTRVFARHGISPMKWLWDYRLDKAKRLLKENPTLSITEIALSTGFNDSSHFSRAFSKKFGVAPSRIR
ncbi:MAG: helix-turn-helix domain-containing protein [Alcaligenaceae bacterium]|jgi:AraC-like DNA-binding protein|nr:helix-turn-helix domain-containing protein [Alcaligenaceae bacterium]